MKELLHTHNLTKKILNSSIPDSTRKILRSFYNTKKGTSSYWGERPDTGERGASNYIKMDPTSWALIEEVSKRTNSENDKILDLGCNVGRHLNGLREKGFKNLYGVDLSKAAREVSKEAFPELNAIAYLEENSFENFLQKSEDNAFDIIYTHGATVEHVNPAFPLVREICRTAKNYVVFATVYFSGSTYPRFWIYEFEKHGFYLKKLQQPEQEWAPDSKTNRPCSLAVFQSMTGD